ncbi:MAG: von Willebrand factor type [Acidimicrobiales bacterium]|nr:von Willebrand factor type [Acidimicrobiales bacterium]
MTPAALVAVTFRAPDRLWLLALVVLLGGTYLALQRRRGQYAVRFTNLALLDSVAPKRPGWRRHLPAALALLCLATMVGAFAKPARSTRQPRERATVILAIDTSLSMDATDVSPTRLKAAQKAALEFIDLLPAKLNLGLVSFNGVAQIRVGPTTDRQAVRDAVNGLKLGERTAIGEAIYASLEAIKSAPPGPKGEQVPARIVLLSDGETTTGRPDAQAAAEALNQKVPVSTIAFGTDTGTIQLQGEALPVNVRVNRDALRKIAEATNGTAFDAVSATQLKRVYQDIGSSVGYVKAFQDMTTSFVGAAMVLLFIGSALSLAWFSRLP